jgi:hypothetical protein
LPWEIARLLRVKFGDSKTGFYNDGKDPKEGETLRMENSEIN